jgi:probable HAF family extracellular repeat protein
LWSFANAINDAGQVVGRSDVIADNHNFFHAFFIDTRPANPTMRDLGTLGGSNSTATAVNNAGIIVGNSLLAGDSAGHAFIYQNGAMSDLNTLTPAGSGWVLENATSINNFGQIVGTGTLNGSFAGFRLDPGGLLPSSSSCNGTYNGTFNGNLTASDGQNCILVAGSVAENITQQGASLSIGNFTVDGNVQVQGRTAFSIGYAAIGGNLQIQNVMAGATASQVCGTSMKGNLQLQNSGAPALIGAAPSCAGNQIGGNLSVQCNTATTVIGGNTVTGNLQDQINTAPTQVSGNTVQGNLQCQGNSSITGGANTAAKKQGQCAATSGF